MSNQPLGDAIEEQLQQAMMSGLLPDAAQVQAEKIMTRMHQPVRLALLGMPGSGKSSMLNLLVADEVLPAGIRLPTMQLTYGDQEQAICTLSDGSKKTLVSAHASEIAALSPVFVEMQMPLAALKKITVLETVAPADPNALHRASQWAAKRADVVLWCTKEYSDDERRIWTQMPDTIKDHGLLMITHMDQLQANNTFDGVVGSARTATMGEFDKVLPIDLRSALSARQDDGNVDKGTMRTSGGLALIKAVLKQVDQGKRFAVDMAEVLLLQNADVLAPLKDQPAAPVVEDVAPEAIVEEEVAVVAPDPDPIAQVHSLAARRATEDDIGPDTRAAYEHVLAQLQTRAAALVTDQKDIAPAEVMDACVDQIQWVCDYLNDNGNDAYTQIQNARDTAFDAADLVQLMQMEKRDSAAIEAVTLLLQVKRELQADLVA
jgi:hypothetical protein